MAKTKETSRGGTASGNEAVRTDDRQPLVMVELTAAYNEQRVAIGLDQIGLVRALELDKRLGRTLIQHRTNSRRCWEVAEHYDDVVARIRAAGGVVVGGVVDQPGGAE